ncbi:hypothetical protein pb186bvf_003006 [Paramecium bursaria]
MRVIKGCTKLDCDHNIFLCDQCAREHPHDANDINDFSQKIGDYLKDSQQNQKLEWVKFCSDEQNKQLLFLFLKKNYIEIFIANKIQAFSNEIKKKREMYLQRLSQMVNKKLEVIEKNQIDLFKKSAQQYREQLPKIVQSYESTFKDANDFYQIQNPFVLENKILSQDDPEKFIEQIKQSKNIDLSDLMKNVKQFEEIKCKNTTDFEELFCKIETLKYLAEKNCQTNITDSSYEFGIDDGLIGKQIADIPLLNAQQSNPGQRDKETFKVGASSQKQRFLANKNEPNIQKQQINIQQKDQNQQIPKQSLIAQQNVRFEELRPSMLVKQGVKFMIFLSADLMIYGTDKNLFSLKNTQQLQQIPLQIDYISCLDKLDNNSFIVGGQNNQGEGLIFKYYQTLPDQFQSLMVLKIKGDFLTMIGISKESIAFINTEKLKNREIIYSLYFCKFIGVPNQFTIKQDLGQAKKKKIKIYGISDNQFCLHLINEYISLIQINEELKIFQELRKMECTMNGSVIPLITGQYLFSTCVEEEKMNNIIINLNDKVKVLTGDYVWQTKSNIFDNIIAVLQITEKGKLFLALIDKYVPLAIQNQLFLGQLDIQLEQSSNYNLLVHFIEDQLYIKDEKTDSIKIYKIYLQ